MERQALSFMFADKKKKRTAVQFVIENLFSLGRAMTLPHQQGKSILKANKVSLCVSKTSSEAAYSQESYQ